MHRPKSNDSVKFIERFNQLDVNDTEAFNLAFNAINSTLAQPHFNASHIPDKFSYLKKAIKMRNIQLIALLFKKKFYLESKSNFLSLKNIKSLIAKKETAILKFIAENMPAALSKELNTDNNNWFINETIKIGDYELMKLLHEANLYKISESNYLSFETIKSLVDKSLVKKSLLSKPSATSETIDILEFIRTDMQDLLRQPKFYIWDNIINFLNENNQEKFFDLFIYDLENMNLQHKLMVSLAITSIIPNKYKTAWIEKHNFNYDKRMPDSDVICTEHLTHIKNQQLVSPTEEMTATDSIQFSSLDKIAEIIIELEKISQSNEMIYLGKILNNYSISIKELNAELLKLSIKKLKSNVFLPYIVYAKQIGPLIERKIVQIEYLKTVLDKQPLEEIDRTISNQYLEIIENHLLRLKEQGLALNSKDYTFENILAASSINMEADVEVEVDNAIPHLDLLKNEALDFLGHFKETSLLDERHFKLLLLTGDVELLKKYLTKTNLAEYAIKFNQPRKYEFCRYELFNENDYEKINMLECLIENKENEMLTFLLTKYPAAFITKNNHHYITLANKNGLNTLTDSITSLNTRKSNYYSYSPNNQKLDKAKQSSNNSIFDYNIKIENNLGGYTNSDSDSDSDSSSHSNCNSSSLSKENKKSKNIIIPNSINNHLSKNKHNRDLYEPSLSNAVFPSSGSQSKNNSSFWGTNNFKSGSYKDGPSYKPTENLNNNYLEKSDHSEEKSNSNKAANFRETYLNKLTKNGILPRLAPTKPDEDEDDITFEISDNNAEVFEMETDSDSDSSYTM